MRTLLASTVATFVCLAFFAAVFLVGMTIGDSTAAPQSGRLIGGLLGMVGGYFLSLFVYGKVRGDI